MANTKISALTSATTPVAGTEVLPIVQSSTTKQVSIANLTAGRSVSAADYVMSTGNLVPSTAAKGINFTANTPAAGMTSQLLNWYEEGTWTPVATSDTGSITTYTSSGTYTRVGRQVYITGRITLTNPGTAGGKLLFSGLPFTLGAAAQGQAIEAALSGSTYFVGSSSGATTGSIFTIAFGAVSWVINSRYDFSMVYRA